MKNLRLKPAKTSKQIHLLLITKTSSETLTAPHQNNNQSNDLLCELYNSYASSLRSVIFNLVPSAETTEDLLHDSFVKINNALHTYQPQRSQLFTWMKTKSRNGFHRSGLKPRRKCGAIVMLKSGYRPVRNCWQS